MERLATQYFGSWTAPAPSQPPAAPLPAWRQTASWQAESGRPAAPAGGPRELRMSLPGGPYFISGTETQETSLSDCYLELLFVCVSGYHRPPESSIDAPVIAVLTQILSGSRSSRFYKVRSGSSQVNSACNYCCLLCMLCLFSPWWLLRSFSLHLRLTSTLTASGAPWLWSMAPRKLV